MVQISALLIVLSGLYYGYIMHNMEYELKMFIYGGLLFYISNWINAKFFD